MRYVALGLIVCCGSVPAAAEIALLDRFTETGIVIDGDQACVVPKPSLHAGQDAESRQKVLDDLAGGRGWKSFRRRSVVAPVEIDVKYIKDSEGNRIGHQAHSAFIVHAPLQSLKDRELMQQVFGEPNDDQEAEDFAVAEFPVEDLQKYGIEVVGEHESYGTIQVPLLKRVIVRGVIQTQRSVTDDQVVITWQIDPRFTGGPGGRNTWAPIERDDFGKKLEGKPQPYQGAGGYMCVTRLNEVPNACLVESHLVLHEPKQWFRGSNVLRSKLPLIMQESARSFRRKLMEK